MVMTPAIRRSITSVVCLVAVACASFAWTAIVYLRTWADPGTPARVVTAVLDDADARDEVVAPLRRQLSSGTDLLQAGSSIEAAIDVALADPANRERIATAFAPPDGTGGVQPGAALDVLVAAVADVDPAVADRLVDVGPEMALPDVSSISSLRSTAQRWAWRVALLALGLFAAAFAAGDRRLTARRYGWWATGTGLMWWLGPALLTAAARRWVPSFDATTSVVVEAYVGPVRPWAIGLACSGAVAFAVALFVLGRSSNVSQEPSSADPVVHGRPTAVSLDRTMPIPALVDGPAVGGARIAGASASGHPPGWSVDDGGVVYDIDDVDVWAAYATRAPNPGASTWPA